MASREVNKSLTYLYKSDFELHSFCIATSIVSGSERQCFFKFNSSTSSGQISTTCMPSSINAQVFTGKSCFSL